MTSLHRAIENYLALRRSLGFELENYESVLHDFAAFARKRGGVITRDLALRWALRPENHHPAWRAARLSMLRGFAKYRSGDDSRTELLPVRLLPHRRQRKTPHLYSDIEIRGLIRAARRLSSARDVLRPFTYSTLLGLLACTGIRISEAISLDREDFDSGIGVLTIRRTKFAKSRLVPLHPSTQRALARYLNEFVFRFNRRHSRSRGMVFYRVLELAAGHDPVRYRDIIASRRPRAVPPTPPRARGKPPSLDRPPANRPWRANSG